MPPGREGAVYRDPVDPDFVIKIPHTPDDEWREKLEVMLAKPLNALDVAWPTDKVLSSDGTTIVGCRLPYAANKFAISDVYTNDPQSRWLTADYAFRLQVATNLAVAIDRIHKHGCMVGDIAPKNILVGKDGTLCIIDADSFQVTNNNGQVFRCKVGTPEYTPRELHGLQFSEVDRTVQHDAFGLAAFIFQLLVGPGTHPFMGRYTGVGPKYSLIERIAHGIWPYAQNGHAAYEPRTDSPLDLLHPLLQPLVFCCFQLGHTDPAERPLPEKWIAALNSVQQDTDFVRVTAPRLEAASQLRHRKTLLAANAAPAQRPRAGGIVSMATAALRRPWIWKTVLASATCMLLLAMGIGIYCAMPDGPRIPFAGKSKHPLPTPTFYGVSSATHPTNRREPRSESGLLQTPAFYREIAAPYR